MILERIKSQFPDAVLETFEFRGDLVVAVKKEAISGVMAFVKTDPDLDFNILMDLTAVDYFQQNRKPRFDVVYHLFSLGKKRRLRVKSPVGEEDPELDSLVSLWPIADWFEREVWDMFGIRFKGHPDLKRILLYESFVGHPLRKDYPIGKRQPLIRQKTDTELNRTDWEQPV